MENESNLLKSEMALKIEKLMEELKLKDKKMFELLEEKNNLLKELTTQNLINNEIMKKSEKEKTLAKNFDDKENQQNIVNTSSFFKDENSLKLKINKRNPEIQKQEVSLIFEDNLENLELTSILFL